MTHPTPRYLLAMPETEDGPCELVDTWVVPQLVLCVGTAEECRRVLEGLELLAMGARMQNE